MARIPLRRAWRVHVGDGFNRYVADVSEARLACFLDLVKQLRAGTIDVVPSGFERDVFYVFACDVVISAVVENDRILLATVTDAGTD
ncbi:MAG: hypothetical protein ABUS56_04260 [Acidobacteriota bacterium]